MTHRFHYNNDFYLVVIDEEKKLIKSVEIEGELPLLVCNALQKTSGLWLLDPEGWDEYEIEVSKGYEETNEDGTTSIWHWCNDDGEVVVRVVIFNSNAPEDNPAQVIVTASTSLFVFMTDYKDWAYSECYGNPVAEIERFCKEWKERNYPEEGE